MAGPQMLHLSLYLMPNEISCAIKFVSSETAAESLAEYNRFRFWLALLNRAQLCQSIHRQRVSLPCSSPFSCCFRVERNFHLTSMFGSHQIPVVEKWLKINGMPSTHEKRWCKVWALSMHVDKYIDFWEARRRRESVDSKRDRCEKLKCQKCSQPRHTERRQKSEKPQLLRPGISMLRTRRHTGVSGYYSNSTGRQKLHAR